MTGSEDLLKGTLDMLVLKAIEREPMHGWGIGQRIEALAGGVFRVQTGTLYPALHRLQREGAIGAEWRTTEHKRRARYYRLTASGKKRRAADVSSWVRSSVAVNRILEGLS